VNELTPNEKTPIYNLKPIPKLVRYVCNNGHPPTVAEAGGQYLCQNCVNEFLAKNVGFMEEVPDAPPENQPTTAVKTGPVKTGEFMGKPEGEGGTG